MDLEGLAKQFIADRHQAGVRYFSEVEDLKKGGKRKVRRHDGPAEAVQKNHLDADVNAWLQENGIVVPPKDLKSLYLKVDDDMPAEYRGEAAKKVERMRKRAK